MKYLLILIILTGCYSKGCIKFGGSYGEYSGDIEYCFDDTKSKEAGTPVFSGGGKDLIGLTKEQVLALTGVSLKSSDKLLIYCKK